LAGFRNSACTRALCWFDFDFKKRFTALKAELEAQLKEEAKPNRIIAENLSKIKLTND